MELEQHISAQLAELRSQNQSQWCVDRGGWSLMALMRATAGEPSFTAAPCAAWHFSRGVVHRRIYFFYKENVAVLICLFYSNSDLWSRSSPVLPACLSAGPSDPARYCWSGGWTSCETSSSAWPGGRRRCSRSPPACLRPKPKFIRSLRAQWNRCECCHKLGFHHCFSTKCTPQQGN